MLPSSLGALSTITLPTADLILLASLRSGLVLILASWTFLTSSAAPKATRIIAALVLLTAGIVVPLAVRHYPLGWIGAVLIITSACALIPPYQKQKSYRTIRTTSLVVLVATGILLSVSMVQERRQVQALTGSTQLGSAQAVITNLVEKANTAAGELVELAATQDILSATPAEKSELIAILSTEMRQRDLDFLTIADSNGTIVTRVHQQGSSGGSLFQDAPWTLDVLTDAKRVGGRAVLENNLPSAVGASVILVDAASKGVLITGSRIDENQLDSLAAGSGIAIATQRGVTAVAAENALARSTYQSAALDERLRTDLLPSRTNDTPRYTITNGTNRFIAETLVLSTLSGGDTIGLVAVSLKPSLAFHPIWAGLLGIIVGLLITVAIYPKKWLTLVSPLVTKLLQRRRNA